jgi:putative DNA primase/helicase
MLTSDNEGKFLDAMAAVEVQPHGSLNLVPDGRIHRYRVAGDKSGSDNGWYVLYDDGDIPAGAFGSWKTGVSQNWCVKSEREFSPAEREAWRKKQQAMQHQREMELQRVRQNARDKAAHLWELARPAAVDSHPYLLAKAVKPYGLKRLNEQLLIALWNASGVITSLQFINADGSKKFLTGGEVAGSYFAMGKPETVLCICEGFATGASIREATGYAVAVAFNAGNLLAVGRAMREKFPALSIIVCADNDVATEGNPGLNKAQECARQVGGMLAVAKFQDQTIDGKTPTDFNDMHRLYGLATVKSAIDEACSIDQNVDIKSDNQIKKAFLDRIDASDDIDFLIGDLLVEIAQSGIKKPLVEYLVSQIAKKCNVSKKVLLDEIKLVSPTARQKAPSHLQMDEVVSQLNDDHAVLPMGGRVVIMNREYDPVLNKRYFSFSSKSDFELRYCNRKVYDRGDEVGWGEYWLNHSDRAEYKGMVFLPGEHQNDYLNLWMGWGVEPGAGDCSRYLTFVHEVICSGDDELYDYIMNWLAHLVQRPQELPETALVFRGREGIGKNTFIDPISDIVGREHYLLLSSLNQVTGRFSGHLANALLVFCNESVWGGDKSAQGVLKSMITDQVQPIEYKGRDLSMVKSFRRMIFATNEQWAVPRGEDDRRYVITDVSAVRKEDWEYFKQLRHEMANGGTSALFQYLLERDIQAWHPRQIPKHILLRGWEMKIMSAGSVVRWWFEMLQQGYMWESDGYSEEKRLTWPDRAPFKQINDTYLGYCNRYKVAHPEHSAVIGRVLSSMGVKTARPRDAGGGRYLQYVLPGIDEARATFSQRWGIPEAFWAEHESGDVYG